jgi:hypothetical protein
MKFSTLVLSALVAFGGTLTSAQTNKLATVNVVTGVVTVTDRVGTPTNRPGTVGNNLAGLAYVAGNVPGAVDTSISFFTLTGATLPPQSGRCLHQLRHADFTDGRRKLSRCLCGADRQFLFGPDVRDRRSRSAHRGHLLHDPSPSER